MKNVLIAGALAALAGTASAGVIASTSFENAFVGDRYVDTGDASVDHDLINNAGQSVVDFLADGTEMGYDAYYRNTRGGVGLTDGDFVGATNFAGTVGAFTDGVQGYEMQDADGTMGMSFDTVNYVGAWNLSFDLYIQTTGWESDDSIHIWAVVDGGTSVDILNTIGSDVNDLMIEGSWLNMNLDLSAYTEATLYVELESNSGSEAIYLDNVVFATVPTPGTFALLGLGGLVGARRRR
ncbi:hypothetical protein COB72_04250 [bacterium]|nr:MAG: hypothetical protein COB72_04250 [bacterium]